MTLPDRFWSKVDKTGDCWIWTAAKSGKGYGKFCTHYLEPQKSAHRLAWADANGPIPPGMHIDHVCHVRNCVNPAHLRLATPKQNQENRLGGRGVSGVRNVYWHEPTGQWRVKLRHNYRTIHGGLYDTIEEADQAARALRDRLYTHHLDGLAQRNTCIVAVELAS